MLVEITTTETLTLRDVPGLDPVTVFLQDFGAGRGRITVECWGRAWSTFFGSYGGNRTLRTFCAGVSAAYLAGRFEDTRLSATARKKDHPYLARIVEAVQFALTEA